MPCRVTRPRWNQVLNPFSSQKNTYIKYYGQKCNLKTGCAHKIKIKGIKSTDHEMIPHVGHKFQVCCFSCAHECNEIEGFDYTCISGTCEAVFRITAIIAPERKEKNILTNLLKRNYNYFKHKKWWSGKTSDCSRTNRLSVTFFLSNEIDF